MQQFRELKAADVVPTGTLLPLFEGNVIFKDWETEYLATHFTHAVTITSVTGEARTIPETSFPDKHCYNWSQ